MSLDPDIYDEMHRLPFSAETADRLLAGRLSPEDAPPAGRDLAVLFASATGAPTPDELAHRDHVVAAAVATLLSSAPLPEPTLPRRRSMLSKILTAKVAAAATVAAFGLGTAAAAAAGSLPGQDHAGSHAATGLAIAASHPSTAADTASPTGRALPPTGPANVHAQWGLCTAFLAAQKSTTSTSSEPAQYSSTAFKALIAEHGGIAGTKTYCQSLPHPGSNKPDTSTNTDTPEGSGKPASPGNSAGKGKSQSSNTPPTSTGKPSDAGRPTTPGRPATGKPAITPPNSSRVSTAA